MDWQHDQVGIVEGGGCIIHESYDLISVGQSDQGAQ